MENEQIIQASEIELTERIWEILFIECGITKSVLIEGESAIVIENKWRNANPSKDFIQIQLYK